MKSLSLLIVVILGGVAFAQEDLRNELNSEIQVLYKDASLKKKSGAKKVAQRQDIGGVEEESRSVIINNNVTAPNSDRVKEEPSTTVEAAPVETSKGAAARRAREQVERGTEDTIVQKLETDRLEAEKERTKRAAEVFEKKREESVVAPAAPIAVQEVAPAPMIYVAPTQTVKTEVNQTQSIDQVDGKTQVFVGALGGYGNYTTASNVQGKMAAGILVGLEFPENFILEGNVVFSQYDINNVPACTTQTLDFNGNCNGPIVPINQRMTQTNIGAGAKYVFLSGRVRPVIGGFLSYTKRSFENRNNNYYNNGMGVMNTRQNYPDSWSIDGAISGGVDVKLSEKFHIGADLKYFTNLTYDRDDNPQTRSYGNSQPIEELSYYLFSAQATFRF